MFKVIRRIVICLIIAIVILTGIQWKSYQKKSEYRTNALLYFQEEDYQKVISYLEDAMKQVTIFGDSMDEDCACYLAESYYKLEDYEKAVKIYDSLIKNNSKKSEYYLLKAEAYEAMKENDKAVDTLLTGWDKTKDSAFLDEICDSYLHGNNYEKALEYAEKGVEANNKQSADFLFKEIVIYEKCNDYNTAYEKACDYVEKYPEDEKGQKELKFLTSRIG